MKIRLLVLLLALGVGSSTHAGQAAGTIYSELTFVDVAPGHLSDWREQMVEVVKPLAQQRIDDGELFAWAVYGVRYGEGDHDMVIIRQAIDPAQLEAKENFDAALWETVHGDRDRREAFAAIGAGHETTERVMYALDQFHSNLDQPERPWLQAAFIDVPVEHQAAYDAHDREVWGPLWARWVEEGEVASVTTYRVVQPFSGGHGHSRALVIQYPSFAALAGPSSLADAIAAEGTGKDFDALYEEEQAWVRGMRSETWQLLELAVRRPPPASGD